MAKPWSKDEVRLLKRLFPSGRTRQVVAKIGRPLTAVRQKAYDMGLKTPKPKYWLNEEIKVLKKLYPTKTAAEIACRLGRSVLVVRNKIFELALKKHKIAC